VEVASGGLVANPASLVNILCLMRYMEQAPEPELVSVTLHRKEEKFWSSPCVAWSKILSLFFKCQIAQERSLINNNFPHAY
jgi:hypothetical protein